MSNPLLSQMKREDSGKKRDPFDKIPFTIRLISQGYSDHEIRKRLCDYARQQGYKTFSRMSADRVLRCAHLAMRATMDKDVAEHRANVAYQLYEISRDPDCAHKDRINALKALARLLGLNHEQEVALFGDGSAPRFEIVTPDWESRLRALRDGGALKTIDVNSIQIAPPPDLSEPAHIEPEIQAPPAKHVNGNGHNGHNGHNGNGSNGYQNGQPKKPK